jgi:single-strand DNA-binding protein
MLIGRLTRDPEVIGSGLGAKFGFAVNNRRLNKDTQEWEDVPVFVDMEVWNRGENKMGDRVLQTLRKGKQVYIEGGLKLDQWEDKNGGGKRSALRVVVENFQYLEPRGDAQPGGEPAAQQPPRGRGGKAAPPAEGDDDPIPF